jgi:hypothetical protein
VGAAARVSGGTTQGCVTILWVNRWMTVVLRLGPTNPEARFEMHATPVATTTMSQMKSMYR